MSSRCNFSHMAIFKILTFHILEDSHFEPKSNLGRYHLHEQEQQLENNGGGEIGDEKYCGIEKVVQVTFILHWEGNTYLGKIQ